MEVVTIVIIIISRMKGSKRFFNRIPICVRIIRIIDTKVLKPFVAVNNNNNIIIITPVRNVDIYNDINNVNNRLERSSKVYKRLTEYIYIYI